MAVAGFCRACQQNVWLNEQWGCVNGHAWSEISKWYDPATGTAVTPYWLQPQQPAVAQASAPAAVQAPASSGGPVEAPPAAAPAPIPVVEAPPAAPATQESASVSTTQPATEQQASSAPTADQGAASAGKDELLGALTASLAQYPTYRVERGVDTDLVIDNKVADAVWAGGKKKVEYEAMLKAVEPERTIYLWEMLKEIGSGFSFGGVQAESWSTSGTRRSGKTKGATLTPDGVKAAYDWDYGATRQLIESVAVPAGWRVKVVLKKSSARWK